MKNQIPLLDTVHEILETEDGEPFSLLKAIDAVKQIRASLPKHFDDRGTNEVFRTISYLLLKAERSKDLGDDFLEKIEIHMAYNFMRIESGEMTILGRQEDRLGKQPSSSMAISEKAKGYFSQFIEPRDLNYKIIWQDTIATVSQNYVGESQLSTRTIFNLLLMVKLRMLKSQYNLVMGIFREITGFEEERALKELISQYVKLIKSPKKQLDLLQGQFLGLQLNLSKETTSEYCLRAIEFFQDKLEVIQSEPVKVDLQELRKNFLPNYQSCFISYSSVNQNFAAGLSARLAEHGVKCWLDKHEILAGDNISASIDKGIKENDRMILICSKDSLKSWWVEKELAHAFEREKMMFDASNQVRSIIIPVDLDGYITTWDGHYAPEFRKRSIVSFNFQSRRKSEESINLLLKALLINKYYDTSNLPDEPI